MPGIIVLVLKLGFEKLGLLVTMGFVSRETVYLLEELLLEGDSKAGDVSS